MFKTAQREQGNCIIWKTFLKTNNILLFLFGAAEITHCSFKGALSVLSFCYAGQYGTSLESILTPSDMGSASRKSRKTVFRY